MALSKRLRYEILRRDNHTCHYCGGTSPTVALTVDHVIPRALGGTNDPSNLVAACRDCNAGKSSSAPDAPLIGAVAAKDDAWAAARDRAADAAVDLEQRTAAAAEIIEQQWDRWLPRDWANSVRSLMRHGLPVELIPGLIEVALTARGVDDRWRYFCGCAWRKIRDLEEAAGHHATPDAAPDAQAHAPSICAEQCVSIEVIQDWNRRVLADTAQFTDAKTSPDRWECQCSLGGGKDKCLHESPDLCRLIWSSYAFGFNLAKAQENT